MEHHSEDEISGTVGRDAHKAAIGKDIQQVSIYSDRLTWREFVRRDLESLEQRLMILLIAVFFLFILGAVATGLTIRQFDLTYWRIDRLEQRIERQIIPPIPGMPIP